jgi:hypothetical protein
MPVLPTPFMRGILRQLVRDVLVLQNLKLEMEFFAAKDVGQVKLPKLSCESKRGPVLVEIRNQFQTKSTPEIRQAYVSVNRLKFDVGVEGKWSAIRHETGERITIEMISMGRVGRPIGICVVRRNDFYQTRRFSYAMKLANKRHDVRNVLNDVTANDFIKFVVGKRVRDRAQVVKDIGVGPRIRIYSNCARIFVLATSYVENFSWRRG